MFRGRIADIIRRNDLLTDVIRGLAARLSVLVRRVRRHLGTVPVDTDDRTVTVRVEHAPTEASTPVTAIDGIGPARSERLAAAGIETVADLLAADLDAVADDTELSRTRLERWRDRARES